MNGQAGSSVAGSVYADCQLFRDAEVKMEPDDVGSSLTGEVTITPLIISEVKTVNNSGASTEALSVDDHLRLDKPVTFPELLPVVATVMPSQPVQPGSSLAQPSALKWISAATIAKIEKVINYKTLMCSICLYSSSNRRRHKSHVHSHFVMYACSCGKHSVSKEVIAKHQHRGFCIGKKPFIVDSDSFEAWRASTNANMARFPMLRSRISRHYLRTERYSAPAGVTPSSLSSRINNLTISQERSSADVARNVGVSGASNPQRNAHLAAARSRHRPAQDEPPDEFIDGLYVQLRRVHAKMDEHQKEVASLQVQMSNILDRIRRYQSY